MVARSRIHGWELQDGTSAHTAKSASTDIAYSVALAQAIIPSDIATHATAPVRCALTSGAGTLPDEQNGNGPR